jgi:hypothetical protein
MKTMQTMRSMKYLVLVLTSVTVFSCSRSQFPTTTRQVVNGKVSYSNNYRRERPRLAGVRPSAGLAYQPSEEQLPVIPVKVVPVGMPGSDHPARVATGDTLADTIRSLAPVNGKVPDLSKCHRIKLKDGPVLDINVVHQDTNRFFYRPLSDPGTPVFVRHDKVEWLIVPCTEKKAETVPEKKDPGSGLPEHPEGSRTDPLAVVGMILTILGMVPILGIPFGILAILFIALSRNRIRKHPEKFKGAKLAKAALILWIAGLIALLLLGIILLASL